jgi:hypothetical protein
VVWLTAFRFGGWFGGWVGAWGLLEANLWCGAKKRKRTLWAMLEMAKADKRLVYLFAALLLIHLPLLSAMQQ